MTQPLLPPSQQELTLAVKPTSTALGPAKQLPAADPEMQRALQGAAKARNTQKALANDWKSFVKWCEEQKPPIDPLRKPQPGDKQPFAHVSLYLTAMATAGYAEATISRHLSTLCVKFREAQLPSPRDNQQVLDTLDGIRRTLGVEAKNAKDAATAEELRKMVNTLPAHTLRGKQVRAVLLFGFHSALRRSDIALTDLSELKFHQDFKGNDTYVELRTTRAMKTNQHKELFAINLGAVTDEPELCPVKALREWLRAANITSGRVFRYVSPDGLRVLEPFSADGRGVAKIVTQAAKRAGLDYTRFAGHSLRAGFVTQARLAGLDYGEIMDQTGHKLVDTVRRYDRRLPHLKPVYSKRILTPKE